ncbi:uncharacterized protein KY384_001406 [Bacidia gigantensis]|uniref:uncharacterized protein n=1 Tax=Bacidia gigantensis TaxID=2732470 RepID=UPI001D050DE1|nr:uncharacterized protein KY384_001406 [Bacidia gigantensis]KAG8533665.1 hypothetical protein KY384_001406 [Bacidia gigantensis]
MPTHWRYVDGTDAPLLIQHDFGPTSYAIWLTDLTYIWTESLDRRRIIQNAFSLDTSIDPSEDHSQMRSLLSCVQKALDQDAGTDLQIVFEDGGNCIALRLTVPLPASLPALQWNVNLQKCPQAEVTRKLVVPLLVDRTQAMSERRSLIQQIKDKDNIISKLVSQMQADGCDLSKAFPGALTTKSSTKANVRQLASKSVKGFAQFEEKSWQTHVSQNSDTGSNLQGLVSNISPLRSFGGLESFNRAGEPAATRAGEHPPHMLNALQNASSSNVTTEDNRLLDEGEFQRQVTPPPISRQLTEPLNSSKQPQDSHQERTLDEDSTTDDEDDDLAPSTREVPTSAVSPTKKPQHPVQSSVPNFDQSSTNESGSAPSSPLLQRSLSPHPEAALSVRGGLGVDTTSPKPKSKLGKIGGKKKAETANQSQPSQDALAMRSKCTESPSEILEKHRHGVGSDIRSSPRKADSRGRQSVPPRQSPTPRENSQERADRNRERLKRELDTKSHAATKKKRKF